MSNPVHILQELHTGQASCKILELTVTEVDAIWADIDAKLEPDHAASAETPISLETRFHQNGKDIGVITLTISISQSIDSKPGNFHVRVERKLLRSG